VTGHTYLGTDIQLHVTLVDGETMSVRLQNAEATVVPETGAVIGLNLETGAARLLAD